MPAQRTTQVMHTIFAAKVLAWARLKLHAHTRPMTAHDKARCHTVGYRLHTCAPNTRNARVHMVLSPFAIGSRHSWNEIWPACKYALLVTSLWRAALSIGGEASLLMHSWNPISKSIAASSLSPSPAGNSAGRHLNNGHLAEEIVYTRQLFLVSLMSADDSS